VSDLLRKLVEDSRAEMGTREAREIDWEAVDKELFARIDQERRLERVRSVGLRAPAWGVAGAALAAAACFALFVGKTQEPRALEAPVSVAPPPAAGNVVGVVGPGQLLVDGRPSAVGATLRLGDVLEAQGATVTVERPGKLTMLIEAGSRARVTHVQGALVLALEVGAIEAQVVPVASGEAFAVDVEGSRVAVHGTHLRVARDDRAAGHVRVDLNEGVVVVGDAPREGSTVGSLVTAPAHAEFEAADAAQSLHVTHDPFAVRAPLALAPTSQAASPAITLAPSSPRPSDARPSGAVAPPGGAARTSPSPAVPAPTPAATQGAAPAVDPAAPATVAAAVRACMPARTSPENVTVVVKTLLHLDLDAEGNVQHARFDPPVAPEVNACAAAVIYRTRFAHGGGADVPIDFTVPSSAP
jgi:hypothetical protein